MYYFSLCINIIVLTVECEIHSSFKVCKHEILKYRGKIIFIEISMATKSKHISTDDALELILEGDQSDLSELSSDEDGDEYENSSGDGSSDEASENDSEGGTTEEERTFKWRKRDISYTPVAFDNQEEDIPDEINPLEYFKKFWLDELTDLVVEQTNLYSIQKTGQSVNTNRNEVEQLIGMNMKMGIVHLPSYTLYWSTQLRYSAIADVMPLKRFEKLRRFLHFVDNMSYNQAEGDKLFKIRPIIEGNYNITHIKYFILCLDNFTINPTVPISRYFTEKRLWHG